MVEPGPQLPPSQPQSAENQTPQQAAPQPAQPATEPVATQPAVPPAQPATSDQNNLTGSPETTSSKGSSLTWLFAIIVIILLGGLGWVIYNYVIKTP